MATFNLIGQEARLLRFPTCNGQEIVFSYAGDLYKVPVQGGEAQRLTSHIGYEIFPRFHQMERPLHLQASMMVTLKYIPYHPPVVSHCA
ncbi:MAG: hypothetical protein LC127_11880 [Chitinophagales bacterium]|nr:hypothetical protein [Chitinophagales bacterium]